MTISFARLSAAVVFLSLLLIAAPKLTAQATPAAKEGGMTAGVEFDGSSSSSGSVYEIDSSVGYAFNPRFSTNVTLPIYVAQSSSSGKSASAYQFGDPSLGMQLKFPTPLLSYNTSLSGTFPTANTKNGFSTGRVTYDWSNHFEHAFDPLTPFVDAGVGNSVMDRRLYHRPYTTLGYNAHFAAGVKKDLGDYFTVSASAYDVAPWGPQKIYSRIPGHGAAVGRGKHGRIFETNAFASGGASLTRDNGYSASLDASPNRYLDLGVGYARSVHYALNTVSFSVGVNLAAMARREAH